MRFTAFYVYTFALSCTLYPDPRAIYCRLVYVWQKKRNEINYVSHKYCRTRIQMIWEVWKMPFCKNVDIFLFIQAIFSSSVNYNCIRKLMWWICGVNFFKFQMLSHLFFAQSFLLLLFSIKMCWWYMCTFNWFKWTGAERWLFML